MRCATKLFEATSMIHTFIRLELQRVMADRKFVKKFQKRMKGKIETLKQGHFCLDAR